MKEVIGGRYRILRRLGTGGMASVYLAHDPLLSRDVAIKVPRLDGDGHDEDTLERFHAELRTIGRLNHPNVVTIYDGGQDDGTPFLVMEPVEGESLAQLIRREAPLPVDRAVDIARQVAEALSYAHEQGVVHRDVKPQNVLLDRTGRAKVSDFGIAKGSDVTRTMTGTILGTPNFMAPEVAAGEPVTPAADVYGLGAVLYQMLTGHAPFEADNPIAAALRSQREDAPPPSQLRPVPGWLDEVVLRALARDPAVRYASAAELAADLAAGHSSTIRHSHHWRPQPRVRVRLRDGTWAEASEGNTLRSPGRTLEDYSRTSRMATPSPALEERKPRRRRPRIVWLLPVLLLAGIGGGIGFAISQAPNQSNTSGPSPKTSSPSGRPNLLTNGELLTNGPQPAGWRLQVFEGREPLRSWRPIPGTQYREITLESASGTDSAWISNDVNVAPGWRLALSGFIQTRNVPDNGSGAALWIVCRVADGKMTGETTSPAVHGSTSWKQVQVQGTAPSGTTACNAQLRLGAPGRPATGIAEFSRIALVAT